MAAENDESFDPVSIINSKFGEDINSLDDLEKFTNEYKTKERSLLSSIDESEKQVAEYVKNVIVSCQNMLQEVEKNTKQLDSVLESFERHESNTKSMTEKLANSCKEVAVLEHKKIYLSWKTEIDTLSLVIQSHFQKNIDLSVENYVKLYTISSQLQSSSCEKLKAYSNKYCDCFYEEIEKILSQKFDILLCSIKYPFPTGISSPAFLKDETEEQFRNTLTLLSRMKKVNGGDDVPIVVLFLTKPFKKRFNFHFFGERHTNNIEKPEWYFAQIVNWIRDHASFLDGYVQKILDDEGVKDINIKEEFVEILISLCKEKLNLSLHEIRDNEVLLAHYIDEVLLFEKELQIISDEMEKPISCLPILLNKEFLHYWLNLERKFTLDSMNEMFSNGDAWKSTLSDLDTQEKKIVYFVPRCVEEFMTLLSLMTDRHKSLNNEHAQKMFLDVVLESISKFVDRVKSFASYKIVHAESKEFCAVLNGVYYMHHVLKEWSDDLYYIQLTRLSDETNVLDCAEDVRFSVFDDVMKNLDNFMDVLVESVTECFETGLKPKVKLYSGERWHCLTSIRDYVTPVLSPTACEVLLFIKEHLNNLQENLCEEVFQKVWKQAAKTVDHLVFREVAFECHFNEGGAAQFEYDIKKNLFIIFGQYTKRPDVYFKLLKESCILLNLLPGSAVLLKEVLQQTEKNFSTIEQKEAHAKSSFLEIGIKYLTFTQVDRLMKARVDWPKV